MKVSYSSIEAFKNCPQKYKFSEIEKIKEPKSREAAFGSYIHEVLHWFYEQDPEFPTLDELLDHYKANWPSADEFNWKTDKDAEVYLKEGSRQLESFYNRNMPLQSVVLELEKHFILDFEIDKEKHHLSGIIDRVDALSDGRYEIIDYKTGKRVPSQKDTDKDLQLSIYALGLLNFWPKLNSADIDLSLYFLKPDIKVTSLRNSKQLETTKSEIIDSILAITKSDFSPTPSRLCDWCGYRRRCPVWHDYYIQNNLSGKRIALLVDEYFILQKKDYQLNQRLKEIKEQINNYCLKHNISQISGKNGVLKKVTGKKITYDISQMIEILGPLNRLEKVLMVNQKMLNDVMQELPDGVKKTILAARKEEDLDTLV